MISAEEGWKGEINGSSGLILLSNPCAQSTMDAMLKGNLMCKNGVALGMSYLMPH